jgi:hypothetical protein
VPSVIQRENPNSKRDRLRRLGRPPKPRRLAHRVSEWCQRTGMSRTIAFERMATGQLRYLQLTPGGPRDIPTTEYLRLGYVQSLDELN